MVAMHDKLKVIIAAHKPFCAPGDGCYLAVQAGAALRADIGLRRDDEGENISARNGLYCELTALYWAWKNLDCDALGLVHYRRYFGMPRRCVPWCAPMRRIATGEELASLLAETPAILPRKRNYFIETRETQYIHAHGEAGLAALRAVLTRDAPEYLPAFEAGIRRTSGHCFNMFVMRRDLCDAYCEWLFKTLFAVEAYMRENMPGEIKPRLFGFISERMIDCWLETNSVEYIELPVVNTESQHWPRKAASFLKRKYSHRKGTLK